MFRSVEYRCQIQRNNSSKELIFPRIVQGTSTEQYPLQAPSCSAEIVTNTRLGTSGYTPDIRTDDFARIQVSQVILTRSRSGRYIPQKKAWEDLFEGTIEEIDGEFGSKNTTSLSLKGYMKEAEYTDIEETKSWTSTVDAQTVLQYFISTKGYHNRLAYDANYCKSGVTYSNYNTTLNQNTLADVLKDWEDYSGRTWRASAVPIYDAMGKLSTVYLSWKPLDTVVNSRYAVVEKSSGYISSNFASSEEDLITRYTVIGSTASSYKATALATSDLLTKYGRRSANDTFTWINSTAQCQKIATGLLADRDSPELFGSALLVGTPGAHPGDLVYCKCPSQEVNGAIVNNNLTVHRVVHRFGPLFTTAIDLQRKKKTEYDYYGQFSKDIKTCKKNIVKCC